MPAVAKPRAETSPKRATALREPAQTVAHFDIRYRQFLDQHGKPTGDLPAFARDRDLMVKLYRHMVLTRTFDARAVSLQRTGQLGTFPSSLGQEAAMVGLAAGMHQDDVLLGTYREQGAQLWRGVALVELFRYWGGNESGTNYAVPREDFPPSIPIATHALHAVGVATAMKLRKQRRCAVCVLGDGATSKGDFYEALNVAGVWNLPVVFVVNNNGWAISVPLGKQTSCETLAQKAIAGGFEGEQVDGNDVIAVRHAVSEAVERARAGKGPTLIETLTYRLSDHTTADDATRYRPDEEVSAAWAKDPVARLRNWLGAQKWWTKEDEERLIATVRGEIDAAKDAYLAEAKEPASAMFDHLYERLPETIAAQRPWVERKGGGDDDHG